MKQSNSKISELRTRLQSIAFLMTQKNKNEEAHSELLKVISYLSSAESSSSSEKENNSLSIIESKEVQKVSRRLKLWAKRPSQINSHILTAFLELKLAGVNEVTEKALKAKLPSQEPFESNFAQMKIIAEKNHGKVFEQYGEVVTLWPPIESQVREYENYVFN